MSHAVRLSFLYKVAVEIAYANNAITSNFENRFEKFINSLFPASLTFGLLAENWLLDINKWLSSLSKEEIETICDGDDKKAACICNKGPKNINDLLNAIFEELL